MSDMSLKTLADQLLREVDKGQKAKSIYWHNRTQDFAFNEKNMQVSGILGFGRYSKYSLLKQTVHSFFQRRYFGKISPFWKTEAYKIARNTCRQQQRSLDGDMLRHVFTYDRLHNTIPNFASKSIKTACVIGDGQANFCSIALKGAYFKKLISINIPEILLNDLLLLQELDIFDIDAVKFVTSASELTQAMADETTKLIYISAPDMEILRDQNIELFVNIVSLQEMTHDTVDAYFSLIKSNHAYFYCCNRDAKELEDGTVLEFAKYPWGACEVFFDELCPWHQFYYGRPSLSRSALAHYDGTIRHRLVKY